MSYVLPTLITCDVPTDNNNLYPHSVVETMVTEANLMLDSGGMIPVRVPLESRDLRSVKGSVLQFFIGDLSRLEAEVQIYDEHVSALIDLDKSKCVLSTMVSLDTEDIMELDNGIHAVNRARLVAVCLIAKRLPRKEIQ